MSLPIFNSALGRALFRHSLSLQIPIGFEFIFVNNQKRLYGFGQGIHYGPLSPNTITTAEGPHGDTLEKNSDALAEFSQSPNINGLEKYKQNGTTMTPRLALSGRRARLLTSSPPLRRLLRSAGTDFQRYTPGKTNLSYVNPLATVSKRMMRPKIAQIPESRSSRYSLKEITSLFIHQCNMHGGFETLFSSTPEDRSIRDQEMQVVSKVFTVGVRYYLRTKRCSPEDVMTWAWILMSRDGKLVGLRLKAVLDACHISKSLIPPFLILYTLQRTYVPRSTLRTLFLVIESLYPSDNPVRIRDHKTTILLSIRLLRHARRSWPELLPRVTAIFRKTFDIFQNSNPPPGWVTKTCNRFLRLLSLSTSDKPYKNIPLLQMCQFDLVRQMEIINAPITREGYRGIITVQLAHHKLFSEIEKTHRMGTHWPPWQIERDGWTETHGHVHEQLLSRAGQVIKQMVEAGYSLADWEKQALVLAGLDTDTSPTIQTRSFWHKGILNETTTVNGESRRIWAARVRATRTINEAWWIFQECRQQGVPSQEVWEEMFEKVIWHSKVEKAKYTQDAMCKREQGDMLRRELWLRNLAYKSEITPGDAKEPLLPPRNPADGVFNTEPVPDVESLFNMMVRDGMKPGSRLTALLVQEAGTLLFAASVLQRWDPKQAVYLFSPLYSFAETPMEKPLVPLNPKVLAAFLSQLCKSRSIGKALNLIRYHRPQYQPAWTTVITGFVESLNPHDPSIKDSVFLRSENARTIWRLYKDMKELVDIDSKTLRLLSVAAERCVTQGLGTMALWDGISPLDRIIPIFFESLGVEAKGSVVVGIDITPFMSPEPAALHSFVRALGFGKRYDEIDRLVKFLVRQEGFRLDTLLEKRVLVAARLFLEGGGYDIPMLEDETGLRFIEKLDGIVRERWGGWAGTENEERAIEEYAVLGGLRRRRRMPDDVR